MIDVGTLVILAVYSIAMYLIVTRYLRFMDAMTAQVTPAAPSTED